MKPAKAAAVCRVPVVAMTGTLTACGIDGPDPAHSFAGAVMLVETAQLSRTGQRMRLGRCRANAIASLSRKQGLKGIA